MPSHRLAALLLWLACIALATQIATLGALPQPSSQCNRICSGIKIPYPFGLTEDPEHYHCAMPGFNLTCVDEKNGVQKLYSFNVEVLNISLLEGVVRMRMDISSSCYDPASGDRNRNDWYLNFTKTPYRFSTTGNKFTVIGCQTLAYIGNIFNRNVTMLRTGCVATCPLPVGGLGKFTTDGTCSGLGCCQTSIPKGLQYYKVWFDNRFFNDTVVPTSGESRCSYGALLEASNFTFDKTYVTNSSAFNDTYGGQAPLLVDWAIGKESCEEAKRKVESYACVSENSECFDSRNGPGYICKCSKGFHGNPYLIGPDGCKDINECTDEHYPCSVPGTCQNSPGGFDCRCPTGYKGDAQNGICERPPKDQTLRLGAKLTIGASVGVLVGLIGFLGIEFIRHKRSIKRQALDRQSHEYFQQHGGDILLELMGLERYIPFILYEREEIEVATDSFDKTNIVGEGGQGTVYKAVLRDTPVAIKICKEVDECRTKDFVQELVILCRVDHPNIVKLLGCCLKFEAPILVYEFVQNRTLQELLHARNQTCPVTLGTRLKIAAQSAGALAFLHTLPRPILHGDVKPANILLGDGWVAKVSDFGCSTIDEKTQAVPKGTPGYLDPEYLHEYQLTSKNDVYSFGVVLLELLTRKKPLSKETKSLKVVFQESMGNDTLGELLDKEIVDEASMTVIRRVAELANQCLVVPGARRPTMRHVAEELQRLADKVQERPQPPLVLERISFTDMESSTSPGYTESETTGFYSLQKKAALSIEFAR